ncbi:Phage protein Gp19/Gp15/Gp42 [Lachnospiraceae bacterium NK3A20]|nr:Phage protein Gp19/Gp15/Gp42 [Lachnospiraceae bacterium NK3A20]
MPAYATVEEIENRFRTLDEDEKERCEALLKDAAEIIDAFSGQDVPESTKALVSRNMVIRAFGSGDIDVPIGATQATQTGLGYTSSVTFGSGQSGELYLSKTDKKLLHIGNHIGSRSPVEFLSGDADA